MSPAKTLAPVVDGWFRMDADAPRLIGTRCQACGSYFFPKELAACRNPSCAGSDLDEVELSSRGVLWSFTNNCYPPPAPYVASEPFEPYAIAAVELEREKMVVLGQVVADVGVDALKAGMEMELALETLFEDDDHAYQVWKWKPTAP